MDEISIEGLILTPLKKIHHPKGDIFHGLKKSDYMDIGSITSDGFGYDNMETPIQGTMSVEETVVSLEENIANSYVPAVIQPFIELVYAPTPSKMRDKFNLERFKSGQYLNDDGHDEGII